MSASAAKLNYGAEPESAGSSTTRAAPAGAGLFRSPSLMPWEQGLDEDRRFKRWLMHAVGVCITLAIVVSVIPDSKPIAPPTEIDREQYAKLVIEKTVVPPPVVEPEPVAEKPKPEPVKPSEKPKPVAKKTPPKPVEKAQPVKPEPVKPKPPSESELRAKAREKAANSGLLALSNELSSMRDKTNSSAVSTLSKGSQSAAKVERNLIASASAGSGLSANAAVSRQSTGVALAGKSQADVVVSQAAVAAVEAVSAGSSYQQSRSADEIRRVMDGNKGAIYSVYNRALRKNPTLEGSFGFAMVIEPSGQISSIKLLNSDLADPTLEKRLLSRIRMIQFDQADVGVTEVNYSFDFLPS